MEQVLRVNRERVAFRIWVTSGGWAPISALVKTITSLGCVFTVRESNYSPRLSAANVISKLSQGLSELKGPCDDRVLLLAFCMRREVNRAAIEIWRFIYTRAWLISPRDGARRNIIAVVNVYASKKSRKKKIQPANPLIRHMIHLPSIFLNPFTRGPYAAAVWSNAPRVTGAFDKVLNIFLALIRTSPRHLKLSKSGACIERIS